MIVEAILDAEEKMEKAVNVAKEDMGSIRTGRANPAMFNKVNIEYYGSMTPVTQVASINTPEPRLVVIKPYEASTLRDRVLRYSHDASSVRWHTASKASHTKMLRVLRGGERGRI